MASRAAPLRHCWCPVPGPPVGLGQQPGVLLGCSALCASWLLCCSAFGAGLLPVMSGAEALQIIEGVRAMSVDVIAVCCWLAASSTVIEVYALVAVASQGSCPDLVPFAG